MCLNGSDEEVRRGLLSVIGRHVALRTHSDS